MQKFCFKGSYWIKPSKSLSFLVHFILFVICVTFLLVKLLLSRVLKSANFIVLLFFTIFKYIIIIIFLFLSFESKKLFKNHLSVNRSFMKISCQNNTFSNNFKNFNAFLTIFNNSEDLKVYSRVPFSEIFNHVEVSHLTINESQLTGFSMIKVFTER